MRDVVIRAMQRGASMLIFDQELTPAQIRCISAMTELKVIDRSQLILDIFARRAKTLDGKVQVELAQLKYLLPRLTGRGVQMSRLMGASAGGGRAKPSWRLTGAVSVTGSPAWSGTSKIFPRVVNNGENSGSRRGADHIDRRIYQCRKINPAEYPDQERSLYRGPAFCNPRYLQSSPPLPA